MEKFNNRQIDEMGRLTLPSEVMVDAKWVKGAKLTVTHIGNIGIIQSEHEITDDHQVLVELDELGKITIPIGLRKKLGLEVRNAVNIYCIDNGIVVIKKDND